MGPSVRMLCKCIARWSAAGLRMTTAQARVPLHTRLGWSFSRYVSTPAEPSGGNRLDEPAQKRGQAASAEVIEARP